VVDGGGAGHHTDVEVLQYWAEGVEEPTTRVDFLWFFSLRQKRIWTRKTPFSAPSIKMEGDTDSASASGIGRMDHKWHT